jgi:hypothetical protein
MLLASLTVPLVLNLTSCDSAPAPSYLDQEADPKTLAPDSLRLLWPAPSFDVVVNVPFKDEQQILRLDNDTDYRVVLPDKSLTHRLDIKGGRDIVIVGGAFRLKGYSDLDTNRAALAFWDEGKDHTSTRIIHVEGLLFDMTDAEDRDAIALNAESAIFQIQNVRFHNVNGDHVGLHPDAIENWGGAKEVRVFRATVITDHQGFLLTPLQPVHSHPVRRIDIRMVDFRRQDGPYGSYPNHKCPIFLWLVELFGSCQSYPDGAFLSEVYGKHAENCWDFGMNDAVPNTLGPEGCPAAVNADRSEMSWPTLPIDGVLKQGYPPNGEFVPDGLAGLEYRSPGYQLSERTSPVRR